MIPAPFRFAGIRYHAFLESRMDAPMRGCMIVLEKPGISQQ
jgi:hypothetical protein